MPVVYDSSFMSCVVAFIQILNLSKKFLGERRELSKIHEVLVLWPKHAVYQDESDTEDSTDDDTSRGVSGDNKKFYEMKVRYVVCLYSSDMLICTSFTLSS